MEIYPEWDTALPEIPPRSALYNLPPIGVGTPKVESLSSYIARLAQAHCLSPTTLLSKVVVTSQEKGCRFYKDIFPAAVTRVLNGIGSRPQILARKLELLTSYPNIRQTTMVTFAGVLSYRQLTRPKRAWCSACFAKSLHNRDIVYEQLLWTIIAVTVCPWHRQRLESRCPTCGHEQNPLLASMHPGHCGICQTWLGDPTVGLADDALAGDELKQEVRTAELIGELLATAAHFAVPPTMEQFGEKLNTCIDVTAWGSIHKFSHQVGIWHIQIRRLLQNKLLPSMPLLLRLCRELDVPLVALLTNVKEIELPGANVIMDGLRQHRLKQQAAPRTERMSLPEVDREMEAAVNENPPPSLNDLMRRTGRSLWRLKKDYPTLYIQICTRYRKFHRSGDVTRQEAEVILRTALKENPPPSLQSLFRRMGFRGTGYRYYEHFPELCRDISARYKKHRSKSFDVEIMRQLLEAALTENPPPSLCQIARRLEHGRSFIRKTYPDLTTAITERYLSWLSASRRERRAALLQEIEETIRTLQTEGLRPSEHRIRSRLSRYGNKLLFKQSVREVKEKLGLLE